MHKERERNMDRLPSVHMTRNGTHNLGIRSSDPENKNPQPFGVRDITPPEPHRPGHNVTFYQLDPGFNTFQIKGELVI